MIRKTFLCVAGVIAGVSGAAYNDGFFQQENVVTDAYQKIAARFDATDDASISDQASAMLGNSEMAGKSMNVDHAFSADADEASQVSSVNSAAALSSTEGGSMQDLPPKGGNAKSTDKSATDTTDPTKGSDASKSAAKIAEEKKQALKDAKSMALLDVRFSKETFESPSGGKLKYRKLTPRIVGSERPLPLIVFLHGKGERGNDNVSQLKHGLAYLASREGMQKYPATIIAPQCPEDMHWTTTLAKAEGTERPEEGVLDPKPTDAMRMALELVNSIQITDNINPDRIYVTGLSMGGFGTFDMIARRPSTFAAAVPLCGGGDINSDIVDRFKKMPLWIIHGDDDSVVEVKHSRSMVTALKEVGGKPRYSELAGYGHNIWDAAYADTELYKWMFNQSKTGAIDPSKQKLPAIASKDSTSKTPDANAQQRTQTETAKKSPKPSTNLKEAIQSDWQVLAATQRGRRADPATLKKMQVKFEGESMVIDIGDRSEAAKYKLPTPENSRYRWIDMISQRDGVKDSAGILAMQGNKLVICWGLPGENRPTTFDSKEGTKTLVLQKK